jgi:hypothetical protein
MTTANMMTNRRFPDFVGRGVLSVIAWIRYLVLIDLMREPLPAPLFYIFSFKPDFSSNGQLLKSLKFRSDRTVCAWLKGLTVNKLTAGKFSKKWLSRPWHD